MLTHPSLGDLNDRDQTVASIAFDLVMVLIGMYGLDSMDDAAWKTLFQEYVHHSHNTVRQTTGPQNRNPRGRLVPKPWL